MPGMNIKMRTNTERHRVAHALAAEFLLLQRCRQIVRMNVTAFEEYSTDLAGISDLLFDFV